jgi:hypothetical protein
MVGTREAKNNSRDHEKEDRPVRSKARGTEKAERRVAAPRGCNPGQGRMGMPERQGIGARDEEKVSR